jgi:hypothetical protein
MSLREEAEMAGYKAVVVVVGLIPFVVGCGGSSASRREVRGATYELTGKEMTFVEQYEREEPKAGTPKERCEYWTQRSRDAEGEHTIGVLKWPAEYFEHLRGWVSAKKSEACGVAEKEKETAARETRVKKDEKDAIAREEQKKARAENETRALAVSETEVKNGRCDQDRVDALREATSNMRMMVDSLSSGQQVFRLDSTQIVVATEAGTPLTFKSGLSGEEHLFVFGFSPVKMQLKDKQGYEVRNRSMYESAFTGMLGENADSRVLSSPAGTDVPLTISGKGCALVAVMRQL